MLKAPFLFYVLIFIGTLACDNNSNRTEGNHSNLPDSIAKGKKIFENNCVRCHGMDASGLTGPSLRRAKLKYAPDISSFTSVVEQGIPGTGMPSNWSYSDTECHQLFAYITYLKNIGHETPKGDSALGRIVYVRSGCSNCHMMNGEGLSVGPDLSTIGDSRNPAYLKQAIIDPGATLPESTDLFNGYGFSLYLPVMVVTNDGKKITGLRINEDTYTIQLRDINGNFFSFNKDQLNSVVKEYGQSVMPSFKTTLSDNEIDNLVTYLYKTGTQ